LERILVRFSQLVIEQSQMKEIDINPLVASPERMLALDARIVLHGAEVTTDQLPKPAIRPYPMQYVAQWTMNNGEQVLLRPIRPEDEPLMVRFHESLSDQSVHLRYFHMEKLSTRIAHERLIRKCFIDYDREMALVADRVAPDTGQHEILGVGRLTRMGGGREAEIAVLVTDRFQRAGLGTELMRRLIQVAREEKLERIVANFLLENATLRTIAERLGFTLEPSDDPECMTAALRL
jgi:acetyltransferase